MNRVLIIDFPTFLVARLLPNNELYFPEDEHAGIPNVISEMKWFLYYTYREPGETKALFEARFLGIPIVKLIFSNKTAADRDNPVIPLNRFFEDKVTHILTMMRDSGAPEEELQPYEYEIWWMFRPIVGAGALKPIEGMKPLTAKSHELDGVKINCAAFSIAFHIYDGEKPSRDIKRIKMNAIEIQNQCSLDEFAEASQLKKFVDINPEYRLTIILPGIRDSQRYTYTGSRYNLKFENNDSKKLTVECAKKTVYLILDLEKRHYGVPRGMNILILNTQNSKNFFFCHACVQNRKISDGPCKCRDPEAYQERKKMRIHRNCEYCGKADCGSGRGMCFRKCKNCVAKVRNEYSHDNHRCIVHAEDEPETFQENGQCTTKERKFKLWAFDIESAREFIDGSIHKSWKRGVM